MEHTPENNQVQVIEKSIEVFKTAPQILATNRDRSAKAIGVGFKILKDWDETAKIEDETAKLAAMAALDIRSNNYLVNAATAIKQQKELRSPITQLMDNFKSMFFEAEAMIDKEKSTSFPYKIQVERNKFVALDAKVKKEKRLAAEKKESAEKEMINIRLQAEASLFNYFSAYLKSKKEYLHNFFNEMTLENFSNRSNGLKTNEPALSMEKMEEFKKNICLTFTYNNGADIEIELNNITIEKFVEYAANYRAELILLRDEIIDLLPSKKNQLNDAEVLRLKQVEVEIKAKEAKNQAEIDEANAQREKLKEQQKKEKLEDDARKLKEKEKLDAEEIEAKKNNDLQLEIKANGEETLAMFNKESDIAEIPVTEAKVKEGYEILIKHQAAWVQIFTQWYQKAGKDLTIEKIGSTKLDQMKTWCEKDALANNTFIESKFLSYEETFKAVAKKSKV